MLYKDAGVNIERADDVKKRIGSIVRRTFNKSVLCDFGLFGSVYSLKDFREPVLVSSTDSIGTKVIVAKMVGKFSGLGEDIVNHCVNDILAMGARPLFFLDYLAFHKIEDNIIISVLEGASKSCIENNLSLIGGETAEMPDLYPEGLFDIAGFIVGLCEGEVIDGSNITIKDKVYGFPSSGLHTNGYTLVRKVFFEVMKLSPFTYFDELSSTIGDALLTPHRSYLNVIYPQIDKVKGIAHITGGGFEGNIVRVLPKHIDCIINVNWEIPPIFKLIKDYGNISMREMFKTFNMGIGMVSFGNDMEGGIEIGKLKEGSGKIIIQGIE